MTDAQFAILIATITAGMGTLSAVIKWSVGVLTKSLNDNTSAHLKSVEAMTAMSTKLDFVYLATGKVDEFIREEKSGVVHVDEDKTPVENPKRSRGAYGPIRAKTNPGDGR